MSKKTDLDYLAWKYPFKELDALIEKAKKDVVACFIGKGLYLASIDELQRLQKENPDKGGVFSSPNHLNSRNFYYKGMVFVLKD